MTEVMRSLADPGFLARLVEREWGVAAERVVLQRSLANDVYFVAPDHYLKVYRHDWRSPEEVAWECDLLAHLDDLGIPVVQVASRMDGTKCGLWHAPEGPRPLVLMERIEGHRPQPPFAPGSHREYGRLVARIHAAGDSFRSAHRRRSRDLSSMLDEPLNAVLPWLNDGDRRKAVRLVEAARDALTKNPPTRGLCHGDATMDNVLITDGTDTEPRLVIFDFDLAGDGYLASDFPFGIDNWDHFLAGYREERPVRPNDLAAAPWLGVVGVLESLRFHAVVKPGWRGTESTAEGWLVGSLTEMRNLADGI